MPRESAGDMLPQQTYSPFLPISPSTGRVLQVPLIKRDVDAGTIAFEDEDGSLVEIPVTGGTCKLQWKCDWAMRWTAGTRSFNPVGGRIWESDAFRKACACSGATWGER